MGGERLARAELVQRGVAGDRWWAAYAADGGIGSGKTTRRFRRVSGLLDLCARLDGAAADAVPLVQFPDGTERRADDPEASKTLSVLLGQPLQLRPESSVRHHDESPVHLVTTAGVRRLGHLLGEPVDAARFRANIVLDVAGDGFVEDGWRGREIALGDEVVLGLDVGMPRCVMVGLAQPHDGLPPHARLLKAIAQVHHMEFGLQARVVRSGTVRQGDAAMLV